MLSVCVCVRCCTGQDGMRRRRRVSIVSGRIGLIIQRATTIETNETRGGVKGKTCTRLDNVYNNYHYIPVVWFRSNGYRMYNIRCIYI